MNLKPVILGIQLATIILIITFMKGYGITKYNLIGLLVMIGAVGLNSYMFLADRKRKKWLDEHSEEKSKTASKKEA